MLARRSFAALGALVLVLVGCVPVEDSPSVDCGVFASCDTCTPQVGCGWCGVPGDPGAGGFCSDAMFTCATPEGWVWNPSECGGSPVFPGCVPEDTSGLNPCGYLVADDYCAGVPAFPYHCRGYCEDPNLYGCTDRADCCMDTCAGLGNDCEASGTLSTGEVVTCELPATKPLPDPGPPGTYEERCGAGNIPATSTCCDYATGWSCGDGYVCAKTTTRYCCAPAPVCGPGEQLCGDRCVSLDDDEHCGSCGHSCDPPTATCNGNGECACAGGGVLCADGYCRPCCGPVCPDGTCHPSCA